MAPQTKYTNPEVLATPYLWDYGKLNWAILGQSSMEFGPDVPNLAEREPSWAGS